MTHQCGCDKVAPSGLGCALEVAPSGLGCALDPHARAVNAATLRAINEQGELIAAKRYEAQQLRRAAKSTDLQADDLSGNLQSYCQTVIDNDPGAPPGGDA